MKTSIQFNQLKSPVRDFVTKVINLIYLFIDYVTTLSITQIMASNDWLIMNTAVVAYFSFSNQKISWKD
jgi:hypothetical protein